MINCDMCGSKIENGKCSCGSWTDAGEMENCHIKKAIEKFHEMKCFTFTADMPHLGAAAVYFRGDYNDCKKIEKFIFEMKNRPYYDV